MTLSSKLQRAIITQTKKAIKAHSDDITSHVFEALEASGVVALDTMGEMEIERLNREVGKFINKTIRNLK